MLSIPHALTGAFVASRFSHPIIYIPLTFGLHYLQDWIPHWDVGTGLSSGKRKKSTAIFLEIIELIITVFFIKWFFISAYPENYLHIWLGALTGIMPDLLEAPRNFLKREPPLLRPLNALHARFHHSTPSIFIGLLPQILLVLLLWFLR